MYSFTTNYLLEKTIGNKENRGVRVRTVYEIIYGERRSAGIDTQGVRDRARIALTYRCVSLTDIYCVKEQGDEMCMRRRGRLLRCMYEYKQHYLKKEPLDIANSCDTITCRI